MRVPSEIASAISRGANLGFKCLADGSVIEGFEAGWGGGAYPPPGYLPWNILDVGNGDTYGFYWAIGREESSPVVCTIMHDAWQVLPEASSLAGCIRLHLLTGRSRVSELICTARDFGVNIDGIPIPQDDNEEPSPLDGPPWTDSKPDGIEYWGAPSATDLLQHDPSSPHLRFVSAKEAISKRNLDDAEAHLNVALSQVPEYSEALALFAQVHRQRQNHRKTAETLMAAITSPLCFGARDRKKLINWLKRLDNDVYANGDDPLWSRRNDLTFVEGVKENNDYLVFEKLIEEYHRVGMGVRAVRLRILTGELMGHETVSFRERYGWTKQVYQDLLRADLERAGLQARLAAL